jgi:DNA-binding transcriptional MerR regulator
VNDDLNEFSDLGNGDSGNEASAVREGAHQDKGYLALGELLDLLRADFPDLTVSKIRFLEQQGLLSPERTPSGYRKFFPSHAARLRWILAQQEGTYLPLREIKSRLTSAEVEGVFAAEDLLSPVPAERVAAVTPLRQGAGSRQVAGSRRVGAAGSTGLSGATEAEHEIDNDDEHSEHAGDGSLRGAPVAALGERRHPAGLARRAATAFASMNGPEGSEAHPSSRPSASTIARAEANAGAGAGVGLGSAGSGAGNGVGADTPYRDGRSDPANTPDTQMLSTDDPGRRGNLRSVPAGAELAKPQGASGSTEVSDNVTELRPETPVLPSSPSRFTFAELAAAANMTSDELRQIEQYGLIVGRPVAGTVYFDDDALAAAQLAKSFQAFGVEPRHLRIFRTAVDREADFYAQVVSPLVYRREERSRQQAMANLAELHQLGARLRDATLRQVLRTTFDLG